MNTVLGVIVVFLDISILVALGMNAEYSAEVRWACVALVVLLSLPPLLWVFGGQLIELEERWQVYCRAKRRARAAAARLKDNH
ncbi:hypothetical protein [Aeromonas sp. NJAU223]|uniref:hypothetical protein n=1 Tax=Aeromonas sp. NJAU223 TaxID=3115650 RepID=UPI003DA81DB9